jgi:hypothetical protein
MSLGISAGLLSLVGFFFYIADIFNKKTEPNRVTWCIWTLVGGILCISYFIENDYNDSFIWVPLSYFVGPLIIFILSLRYGVGGKNKGDLYILALSVGSIILWLITGRPWLAMITNIIADFLGAIPTLLKAYHCPDTESQWAWGFFLAGNILNLFALQNWTVAEFLYPLYLCIVSLFIFCFTARQWYAKIR